MGEIRNQELDALRAIAISLVIWEHFHYDAFSQPLDIFPLFGRAWAGVNLFFVLSGFVVTRSLLLSLRELRSCPDRGRATALALKAFWIRRTLRIIPAAYFWIAVFLFCSAFLNRLGLFGNFLTAIPDAIAAMTFTLNYKMLETPQHALGWYWSLCVEEHFYLLLPLLLIFFRKTRARIAIAISIIFVVTLVRPILGSVSKVPEWPFRAASHLNFDFLLSGFILYLLSTRSWFQELTPRFLVAHKSAARTFSLLLIFLLWVSPAALETSFAKFPLLLAVASVLVFLAALEKGLTLPGSSASRLIYWLGSRSYSLYLSNQIGFYLNREIWTRMSPNLFWEDSIPWRIVYTMTSLLLIGLLSELSYRFVENPGIRLGRKWSNATLLPLRKKSGKPHSIAA